MSLSTDLISHCSNFMVVFDPFTFVWWCCFRAVIFFRWFFTFGQWSIDNTQLPRFMQFFWALAFWNCLVLLLEIFACCFGSIVLLYARRNFLISILRLILWNDHLRVLWLRCWASGFVAKDGRGVQVDQDTNAVLWHTADVIGGMTVDGLGEL